MSFSHLDNTFFLPTDNSAFLDEAASQSNVVALGVLDSLSIHRTLPLLVNNSEVSWLTFKIFAANSCLLVGSVVLYGEAIVPGLARLRNSIVVDDLIDNGGNSTILEQSGITRILFYSFIVIPVYIMCYSCSVIWYQSLADSMHKANKKEKSPPLVKAVVDGTYATVAWLCLFIQVQLLTSLTPMILSNCLSTFSANSVYADTRVMFDSNARYLAWQWYLSVSFPILRSCLVILLSNCIRLSQLFGLCLLSVLYGWYGFDPHWIANNIDPDARFAIIEKHWGYFLGFGAPYVALVKMTRFFVCV